MKNQNNPNKQIFFYDYVNIPVVQNIVSDFTFNKHTEDQDLVFKSTKHYAVMVTAETEVSTDGNEYFGNVYLMGVLLHNNNLLEEASSIIEVSRNKNLKEQEQAITQEAIKLANNLMKTLPEIYKV